MKTRDMHLDDFPDQKKSRKQRLIEAEANNNVVEAGLIKEEMEQWEKNY